MSKLSRWGFVVLPIASFVLWGVSLIQSRSLMGETWPTWRDGVFVLAGALVVVAIGFGVHAWQRAQDRHGDSL